MSDCSPVSRTLVMLARRIRHFKQTGESTKIVNANCFGAGHGIGIAKSLASMRISWRARCNALLAPAPDCPRRQVWGGCRMCLSNMPPGYVHAPGPAPRVKQPQRGASWFPPVWTDGHSPGNNHHLTHSPLFRRHFFKLIDDNCW